VLGADDFLKAVVLVRIRPHKFAKTDPPPSTAKCPHYLNSPVCVDIT